MVIIKCDRCGHVEEFYNPFNVYAGADGNRFPKYTISTQIGGEMRFISLCRKCENDFDLFLKRMEILAGNEKKEATDASS